MKKILSFAIIAAITLIQSCVKDEYELNEIEWNPNIAVPLVHSKLTLSDILEHVDSTSDIHDHLFEDGTGFLTLIYEGTLFSTTARDLLDTFLIYPSPITLFNIPWSFTDTLPLDTLNLNLEIYNKLTSGSFYFHDPKIHVNITNSYGVPITLSFTTLLARSFTVTPPTMPIEINGNIAPFITFAPSYPSVPGQSDITKYTYDKTNSNILDFLAISPKYIYYGVIADMNNPVVFPNFVTDTSSLSVNVQLELPLWGYASNIVLKDTVPFQCDTCSQSPLDKEVEYAIFRLNILNGFPADVSVQFYFVDSTFQVLDSLLVNPTEKIMNSGIVDPTTGKVIQPTLKFTEIYVDSVRVKKIAPASQIIVNAVLGTGNQPPPFLVKFYSYYDLDLKLGVRVQLKTTL